MKKDTLKNADFHVAVKIILKNKKGEILGLKMPDDSSMAGYYDLLGGRIREKEIEKPFGEIIKREVSEEIGREVKYRIQGVPAAIARHSYFSKVRQKNKYIFWVFFEGKYLSGKIKISSEHKEYKWLMLDKKNLKKYFTRGPLEGMSHYVLKNSLNEIMKL